MELLNKFNQQHLIDFVDKSNQEEYNELLVSIKSVDFQLIKDLLSEKKTFEKSHDIKPLKPKYIINNQRDEYFQKGLEKIKKGVVAVVLMAGGQGTRLGHQGPKGTYDIGMPSGKSLFHYQCDKLNRLYNLTGTYIRWYIMTSEDNHLDTINHFIENEYFGYSKEHIIFFKQDRMPLVLSDGSVALKNDHQINLAANGNGGVFSSLQSNGILSEMEANGVKWVYLYGVDNVLAKVADPVFLQFAIDEDLPIASKSVDKAYPEEKVGVICYRDNHPDIVEYSELDDKLRYMRDNDDQLLYRNGNILQHYFKLEFLKQCVDKSLPYHLAHKKVSYFDGEALVTPEEPNGYKFELFMFDVFKFTKDMAVLSVKREDEFAPVKNKEGKDSPETARKYIFNLHKRWLAKIDVHKENYEIDTLITYEGEDLEKRFT